MSTSCAQLEAAGQLKAALTCYVREVVREPRSSSSSCGALRSARLMQRDPESGDGVGDQTLWSLRGADLIIESPQTGAARCVSALSRELQGWRATRLRPKKRAKRGMPHACQSDECWREHLDRRADSAGIVTLAFTNFGFVHFWFNLKCSLNSIGVHNDILIGADNATCTSALKSPGTVCVVGQGLFFDSVLERDAHDMGTAAYAQIVRLKTAPVLSALSLGYHVLFTDTDVVWFADPRPWLLEAAGWQGVHGAARATPASVSVELLVQSDYEASNEARCSSGAECRRSFRCEPGSGACEAEVCSGFYLLRASEASQAFVRRVRDLIGSQHDARATEQPAFNAALASASALRLRWQLLPMPLFPNGAAYFTRPARASSDHPFIVHNNWIGGASAKEARFREHGLWQSRGHRCAFGPAAGAARLAS